MIHEPQLSTEEIDALGIVPGLPDEAFEHDGLITKRHQRATAFAFLRPAPGKLMWDVGTGSGAMAIEWCRAAKDARAIGVEQKPERAARARRNGERLAPGHFEVVEGPADVVIETLPAPDAIFIGGGASQKVVEGCWDALAEDGRLVVHAVTVETEVVLANMNESHGGQLSRINVEISNPLGSFRGFVPYRPVTQWAVQK